MRSFNRRVAAYDNDVRAGGRHTNQALARVIVSALTLAALAACAPSTNLPLVSTQYPPGTGAVNRNSPVQTLNSLPPGAANLGPGVGATAPDYASFTFHAL